jgi:hypothetical protein
MRNWFDIAPEDAVDINLAKDLTVTAPLNELGERCPWPWEPQQLVGAPLGQYRCSYCNAMVMAGMAHIDYAGDLLDGATPSGGSSPADSDADPVEGAP